MSAERVNTILRLGTVVQFLCGIIYWQKVWMRRVSAPFHTAKSARQLLALTKKPGQKIAALQRFLTNLVAINDEEEQRLLFFCLISA